MNTAATFNKILEDKDFNRLSDFIYSNYGIKMPIAKKIMLQSRLQNRLKHINVNTFREYVDFIFSGKEGEDEIIKMIDMVSTNKTDFFREPKHFDFLKSNILPSFEGKKMKIWSSASSSGEEAYTIAITIEEYIQANKKIDYSIFGTDISTRILERAVNAIYTEDRIAVIPYEIKKKYFLKSKKRETPLVRVIPALRSRATFERLNLIDDLYTGIDNNFDVIFCRNVLIYFDRPTQEKVINKLCNHLNVGGYFMLGHSESVMGLDVPLRQIMPTVFVKI
jgi:chemotaxis protein methyltransferase CheR